jgi:hypothetical protein
MDRETFIKALEIVVSKTNMPNGNGIDLESICTDFALLAYDEALILHIVSKSFYCIDKKDRLIKCKKQCMHCARLQTI